ncbi:MAG: DNA polymerase III subunit beta [Candidatus Riflebacteria bacterium]|nr:DNA polymerase III subunit beta [Candidatus Riflebacteria bacterium]
MKFVLNLSELNDALSIVGRATGNKVKAILSNVLLIAADNEVRLAGTNLEVMITSRIRAEVETSGQCTIPEKIFHEVVSALNSSSPQSIVTVTQIDGNQIELATGRTKTSLPIQGIEDFPPLPVIEIDKIPSFTIESCQIKKPLQQVSIAMGSEEGNITQRCVCFSFSEGRIKFTSTDIHRLALAYSEKLEYPPEMEKSFLIPAKSIPEILKILDDGKNVRIALMGDQLIFSSDRFFLLTLLYDGKYPDFTRAIPKNINSQLKIKTHELQNGLKTIAPVARLNAGMFYFDIGENETRIWTNAAGEGTIECFVPSELTGEKLQIGFNIKFVTDFLNVADSEDILLKLVTPSFPGLFTPFESSTDYQYIIMPMSVKKTGTEG